MRLFLVHDPDRDSRSILGAYLRHLGHQVLDTAVPQDALTLAREHQPDVVISEFVSPYSELRSVPEALRLDPATATIPVVVWTSRISPETVRRIEACGGILIAKPTSPRAVYQVAVRALEPSAQDVSPSNGETRPPISPG